MKSVPFGLALLLLWPASAPGQTTLSFAGGLNVARTLPGAVPAIHGFTTQGFAIQASVGRPSRGRFAWRIDAFNAEGRHVHRLAQTGAAGGILGGLSLDR